MPTYAYQCLKCGHQFERVLSVADHNRLKVTCPQCRSSKVVQVVTPFFAKTSRKS